MMKRGILGLLAVALLSGPMTADAVVVTVNGGLWDVTTVGGSSANRPLLESQVWYGNNSPVPGLAEAFALAVGTQLGTPNQVGNDYVAPFFAWSYSISAAYSPTSGGVTGIGGANIDSDGTFAVATLRTVPEPGTLTLLGLGLTGLGLSRRRKAT